MFESKIKEVAGLPIIKGEPVILDAVQTIEGVTIDGYKLLTVAEILLPLQIGTFKTDVIFFYSTRAELSYKLIGKFGDTKAVLKAYEAMNLLGSTTEVENQGWSFKKQWLAIREGLMAHSKVMLEGDDCEALGRLIKEAKNYAISNLVEQDLSKLTYQCEGSNGKVVLKQFIELDDYEVIWAAYSDDNITEAVNEPATRQNKQYAKALIDQSYAAVLSKQSAIEAISSRDRADHRQASINFGLARKALDAHEELLKTSKVNRNSISMQDANYKVYEGYVDAERWRDRSTVKMAVNDKQYKALDKKRINRAAWLSDF